MSSYSYTYINGYSVLWQCNDILAVGFRSADQFIGQRKVSERPGYDRSSSDFRNADRLETCYEYRTTAKVMKRRLELEGFNLERVQLEFEARAPELLQSVQQLADRNHDNAECNQQLEKPVLADWLAALAEVLRQGRRRDEYNYVDLSGDPPIIRILLTNTYSDWGFPGDVNFPCQSLEAWLRAVLEVVPEDATCVLDATDVVESGYTDEFEERQHLGEEHTAYFTVFRESLVQIQQLANLDVTNPVLMRLLYANIITAVETYLSDTAKRQILARPALLRRFVENHKDFSDKKVHYRDLFRCMDDVRKEVTDRLDAIVFHNVSTAEQLYKDVFQINFSGPEKVVLGRAVAIRHDIVHRNGKDKAGVVVTVDSLMVDELGNAVLALVSRIDAEIRDGAMQDLNSSDK